MAARLARLVRRSRLASRVHRHGTGGMALERTVIRWLYGRPLETYLPPGHQLILMQAVRSLFGAQNVEVANPSWMSGGVTSW